MGWWSKLKKKRSRNIDESESDEDYIDISSPSETTAPALSTTGKKKGWFSSLRPGSRRDRQIAWLQAGYSEMLTLMRGIHTHLERQEDVQNKMTNVLERLPASMDSLKSVGKAAEQQAEVLALLRDQLKNSVQHDQQLVDSMNKFNQTLGVMDETTRASGQTVARLIENSRDSDKLLREVIERSERRFMLISILLLIAAVVGIGSLLLLSSGRNLAVPAANGEPAMSAPAVVNPAPETEQAESAEISQPFPPLPTDEPDADAAGEPATVEEAQPRRTLMQWLFRRRAASPEVTPSPEEEPAS